MGRSAAQPLMAVPKSSVQQDNRLGGVALMVVSMAMFAVADTLIKLVSINISPAQIMLVLLAGSWVVFAVLTKWEGVGLWHSQLLSKPLLLRYVAEAVAMVGMMNALAKVPLSTVGAIIQANPLVVVLGSVLFLGEKVSWRRWSALIVGFVGVLMIIRPGAADFDTALLWPVLGMVGLAVRDILTRVTPARLATSQVAAATMAALVPVALIWVLMTDEAILPPTGSAPILGIVVFTGSLGYLLLISSIRQTEVSVVAPYRYTRLVFMMIFGMIFFSERPDLLTLAGAALIVLAGLYALLRERKSRIEENRLRENQA